jgi:hypothetical protein
MEKGGDSVAYASQWRVHACICCLASAWHCCELFALRRGCAAAESRGRRVRAQENRGRGTQRAIVRAHRVSSFPIGVLCFPALPLPFPLVSPAAVTAGLVGGQRRGPPLLLLPLASFTQLTHVHHHDER